MSSFGQTIMYARGGRRRKMLNVDLNDTPPIEDQEQVEGPVISLSHTSSGHEPGIPVPHVRRGRTPVLSLSPSARRGVHPRGSAPAPSPAPAPAPAPTPTPAPAPINVEDLDDDVIISSPRAFEQARNNSRRFLGRTPVVDVESGETSSRIGNLRNQRRRLNSQPPVINCELYVNLEMISSMERAEPVAPPSPPPPPPPPRQLTFNCPICMGPLVEEVATKCGHIFCKECINTAIDAHPKCPTCRRKVSKRGLVRIYLPASN